MEVFSRIIPRQWTDGVGFKKLKPFEETRLIANEQHLTHSNNLPKGPNANTNSNSKQPQCTSSNEKTKARGACKALNNKISRSYMSFPNISLHHDVDEAPASQNATNLCRVEMSGCLASETRRKIAEEDASKLQKRLHISLIKASMAVRDKIPLPSGGPLRKDSGNAGVSIKSSNQKGHQQKSKAQSVMKNKDSSATLASCETENGGGGEKKNGVFRKQANKITDVRSKFAEALTGSAAKKPVEDQNLLLFEEIVTE